MEACCQEIRRDGHHIGFAPDQQRHDGAAAAHAQAAAQSLREICQMLPSPGLLQHTMAMLRCSASCSDIQSPHLQLTTSRGTMKLPLLTPRPVNRLREIYQVLPSPWFLQQAFVNKTGSAVCLASQCC